MNVYEFAASLLPTETTPTEFRIQAGHRILNARLTTGLSQKEVAKRIGITQARLCHVEHGRAELSIRQLIAAARALMLRTNH